MAYICRIGKTQEELEKGGMSPYLFVRIVNARNIEEAEKIAPVAFAVTTDLPLSNIESRDGFRVCKERPFNEEPSFPADYDKSDSFILTYDALDYEEDSINAFREKAQEQAEEQAEEQVKEKAWNDETDLGTLLTRYEDEYEIAKDDGKEPPFIDFNKIMGNAGISDNAEEIDGKLDDKLDGIDR